MDLGLQQIGVVVVPIHATLSAPHTEYILRDAGVKACFVNNPELYEKVAGCQSRLPDLKGVYTFEKHTGLPSCADLRTEPDAG
ncbi:AMP-binding protein, partial [Arthrospira platensis SPKY1]|nr:AMP-binding protein [Arthrospira platensis SPKY1]